MTDQNKSALEAERARVQEECIKIVEAARYKAMEAMQTLPPSDRINILATALLSEAWALTEYEVMHQDGEPGGGLRAVRLWLSEMNFQWCVYLTRRK